MSEASTPNPKNSTSPPPQPLLVPNEPAHDACPSDHECVASKQQDVKGPNFFDVHALVASVEDPSPLSAQHTDEQVSLSQPQEGGANLSQSPRLDACVPENGLCSSNPPKDASFAEADIQDNSSPSDLVLGSHDQSGRARVRTLATIVEETAFEHSSNSAKNEAQPVSDGSFSPIAGSFSHNVDENHSEVSSCAYTNLALLLHRLEQVTFEARGLTLQFNDRMQLLRQSNLSITQDLTMRIHNAASRIYDLFILFPQGFNPEQPFTAIPAYTSNYDQNTYAGTPFTAPITAANQQGVAQIGNQYARTSQKTTVQPPPGFGRGRRLTSSTFAFNNDPAAIAGGRGQGSSQFAISGQPFSTNSLAIQVQNSEFTNFALRPSTSTSRIRPRPSRPWESPVELTQGKRRRHKGGALRHRKVHQTAETEDTDEADETDENSERPQSSQQQRSRALLFRGMVNLQGQIVAPGPAACGITQVQDEFGNILISARRTGNEEFVIDRVEAIDIVVDDDLVGAAAADAPIDKWQRLMGLTDKPTEDRCDDGEQKQ